MSSDRDDAAARGPDPDRERRLYEILAEYFEAVEAGRAPDRAEWLARYPDRAEEIAAFLDDQDRLFRLTEPLRPAGDDDASGSWEFGVAAPAVHPGPRPGPGGEPGGAPTGVRVRYVGDYELLGEIARGGMGVVFRARQRSLNRPVAVKMLLAEDFATEADERRFRREAEAAANLDHPHIIPIFEVGRHDGRSYFSMKLVEGGSLSRRLPEFADDPRASARLMAMVSRAVHHAHVRGVLHRDLKPGNILLSGGPEAPIGRLEPCVTDFGLARRVEDDPGLTQSGAILGTASYMAPEQAAGKKGGATVATDVHGLGAVLYALLTGRPPFRGETPAEAIDRARHGVIDPPGRLGRRVDRDLETICLKCLEREPARRYRSAEAVAEDLERWLAGRAIHARRAGRAERAWRLCRRHPWRAAMGAVAAAMLLTTLAEVVARTRDRHALDALDREVRRRGQVLRVGEYVRDVAQASHLLADNHVEEALSLLDRHRPAPGEVDLRGFAWRYLHRLGRLGGQPLRGHEGDVYHAAFSPDGRLLATAGKDRTVRLWDVASRAVWKVLRGHTGEVDWVAFSPDGRLLASAGDDRTVKLWDTRPGTCVRSLAGHDDEVVAALFSPDGRRLIAGSRGGRIIAWEPTSGRECGRFEVSYDNLQSLAISPDGRTLAITGAETVIWDLAEGREVTRLERHRQVNGLAFSHDGRWLATAARGGEIELWETRSWVRRAVFHADEGDIESVAFTPDDRHAISVNGLGAIRLWDRATGAWETIPTGRDRLWCAAVSPNGQLLATTANNGAVWLRDLRRDRPRISMSVLSTSVPAIAFSGDGTSLTLADDRGNVRVVDARSGRTLREQRVDAGAAILRVVLSNDAHRLVTASYVPEVAMWDLLGGRRLQALPTPPPYGLHFALSADGDRIALMASHDAVALWDLKERARSKLVSGGNAGLLAFSPRGDFLSMAGSWGIGRPTLWDDASGLPRTPNGPGHRGTIWSQAFSPDGSLLATADDAGSIILWSIPGLDQVAQIAGPSTRIRSLAFSTHGDSLASGGEDHIVRLWDITSGIELARLDGPPGPIRSLAFSPDDLALAGCAEVAGGAYEVLLWPAAPGP